MYVAQSLSHNSLAANYYTQTPYSEAKGEFDTRFDCEYGRTSSHEQEVIRFTEYNEKLEGELDSLHNRIVEHAEITAALKAKSTEEYIGLLSELEESEVCCVMFVTLFAPSTNIVFRLVLRVHMYEPGFLLPPPTMSIIRAVILSWRLQ